MHLLETHIAAQQKYPIRIQEYAVGIFKTVATKSAIKKAIKKKRILVNDTPTSTARIIIGGEKITLLAPENKISKKQLTLKLAVIFEDDYLALIEKPAGILVSGNTFKTIDNALQQNLQKSTQPDAVRPRPIHRLDYPTSGLLLIGKTSSSINALSALFKNNEIQKTYFAITIGKMEENGEMNFHIDEKIALTQYEVLRTVVSKRFTFLNLVKLSPKTGRKHQLRKHLSSIGNPILGDKEYFKEGLVLNGRGLYLHASALHFIHPFTKDTISITKENPKKFTTIFPDF